MMNNSSRKGRIWHRIKRSIQFLALAVIVLLLGGCVIETIMRNADEEKYPPPGQLVDVGTHQMHIWCEGPSGVGSGPTIVLDAGAGLFSTSWRYVMASLRDMQRVCAFDRSGLGWSETGPLPYDGLQASRELKILLAAAGIETPIIYVGHSLGAMMGQIYYHQYPAEVAGVVLIEPADPEVLIREIGEDRGQAVDRSADIKPCGMRCPIAVAAARLGVMRMTLNALDVINDPLFNPQSLAEFKARAIRPEAIRFSMHRGRFITTIAFQTGDLETLNDLPVIMVTGSESGTLLGDSDSPEDLENDQKMMQQAWIRNGHRSSRNLGLRIIEGANHVSLVAYQQYAEKVSEAIIELLEEVNAQEIAQP